MLPLVLLTSTLAEGHQSRLSFSQYMCREGLPDFSILWCQPHSFQYLLLHVHVGVLMALQHICPNERIRLLRPCPHAVSLLGLVLLMWETQQTNDSALITVIDRNMLRKVRFPRRTIAHLVLALYCWTIWTWTWSFLPALILSTEMYMWLFE